MSAADLLPLARHYYGPGLWLLLAVLAAEAANLVLGRRLNGLGILPREAAGLPGILAAPLLHNDLRHFAGNLPALAVLGFALGQVLPDRFWEVVAVLVAGTGALVWLLARRRLHLGASGLVYALLGFLILQGALSREPLWLALSLALLVLYSGLLWGVLPASARTSWESHLFGLGTGLALAWWRVF